MSIDETLEQLIFSSPHAKLNFSSDNPYFYYIPPRNISDKFTKDFCRFPQPSLVSSTTFDEKLGFPISNYKRIHELITDLIPND